MHAAGICLGTIQARTHVQLALVCQQSMIRVQDRLCHTMQFVYGHAGNLGSECADHGAALGILGQVSNHNLSTRWVHHDFATAACIASCNNIGKLCDIRTETTSLPQGRDYVFFPSQPIIVPCCSLRVS